jgi:glyoxalase/bleomycin resistance protein/dioxygenase superfamily protein
VTLLAWGQPDGGVTQFAYFVEDIEAAAAGFTAQLGVGPWFVRGPFQPDARLRGEPNQPVISLARGFSGHAMFELVQQHDDGPSVFHEHGGPRRYGFHHWAIVTSRFDDDVARLAATGYEEAFSDRLPSGSRVVYMDSTRDLPGMIELVELTAAQEEVYTAMYRAALAWDGGDPIRRTDR